MSGAQRPLLAVLNGPNLNLLGTREPDLYGEETLGEIERRCRQAGESHQCDVDFRQTNHEGILIDWIQELGATAAGLVINAGGLTHTSVALHDALRTLSAPVIEVHLTNVHARERFRHRSYVSSAAAGVIAGLGGAGYGFAVEVLASWAVGTSLAVPA